MQGQMALNDAVSGDFIVKQKTIATGTEDEGYLQHFRIGQCLLHTVADRMAIILGFDYGDWNIGLIEQHIIGSFMFGAGVQLSTNDYPAFSKGKFFEDLGDYIPPSLFQSRCDELGADVALGELFFIHETAFPFLVCVVYGIRSNRLDEYNISSTLRKESVS